MAVPYKRSGYLSNWENHKGSAWFNRCLLFCDRVTVSTSYPESFRFMRHLLLLITRVNIAVVVVVVVIYNEKQKRHHLTDIPLFSRS